MISDKVERLTIYRSIPLASAIQQFIVSGEKDKLGAGQWTQLQDGLKVILLDFSNYREGILETHRNFFDLHVTLSGCDLMNVSEYSTLLTEQEYDNDHDYALWKGDTQVIFRLEPLSFLFLMPHEAHNNTFLEQGTRKFVFKIKV